MKRKLISLIFLLVALQGCNKSTPSVVTPTVEPTPTSIVEETSVTYTRIERTINGYQVPAHLLEVKLKSVTDLRSAVAKDEEGNYGAGITDSLQNIVNAEKEATGLDILGAVNGDYTFSSASRRGYSVKNGIIYRNQVNGSSSLDMVFMKDNTVKFIKEGSYKLDGNIGETSNKYWQVISFGPMLADNYKLVVDESTEIRGNNWVNNQRTCIGIIDWNHFFLMSTEANNRSSKELQSFRLYDLGQTLLEYGCRYVYNLDGGYSSGLAFNNQTIFAPSRELSDILYIVNS